MQRIARTGRVAASLALAVVAACASSAGRTNGDVELVVAATTDVHGWLRSWDYYQDRADATRGLARAATIIDSVRAASPDRVVLVDAGDLLQGTPLADLAAKSATAAHPVIAAMNAMRYDAAVIGNHEFNYGVPLLERALGQAAFPFLAANVRRVDGARFVPAFRIVRRAGVEIGIVGATTPGSMRWDAANLRGRLIVRDIVPDLREAVAEARTNGADVIVVVMHSGLDEPASYDTVASGLPSENVAARVAREIPGVDLIVYGHSHKEMADTVIGSTLLVQPRNAAASVAVAQLSLARVDGRWRVARRHGVLVKSVGHAESPAVVRAVERAHEATLAYVRAPIGTTTETWSADSARVVDTPILDFILEVERRVAGTDLASAPAFDLGVRFVPGPITVAKLTQLYPYPNTLRAVRITGRQLRDYLEHSARYFRDASASGRFAVDSTIPGFNFDIIAGADYQLDVSRPIGQRVAQLSVKGKPVADTDTFTLALNNYRQSGGGSYAMLKDAPLVYGREQDILQLLIDEVKRAGTLKQADYFTRNWSVVPEVAVGQLLPLTHSRFESRASQPASRAGKPTTLRILSTNDFHGILREVADSTGEVLGGATHVARMIERLRAECVAPACVSLLLDGGDMMQGGPASNAFFGRPVMAIMNRDGYDAAAVGNHEFDWGIDTLRARMRDAHFPILAANITTEGGDPVPWLAADTILVRGGLRIGIIGLATTTTPTSTKPENVASLRFVDPLPVTEARARALRARGADVVIVLGHISAYCRRWGRDSCEGDAIRLADSLHAHVDAIVSGHSHTAVDTIWNGIPVVQAASRGRAVAVIDLPLGSPNTRPRVALHFVRPDSLPGVPAIDSIVKDAVDRIAAISDRRIAMSAELMPKAGQQYALGLLVADAMREAGKSDVAIMNNGGIRTGMPKGPVTHGDLFDIHPFGNILVRLDVTGRQLQEWAEALVRNGYPDVHVSGMVVSYDSLAAKGHRRIVRVTRTNGSTFAPDERVRVVLPDFLVAGGDHLSPPSPPLASTTLDVTVLDALERYLQTRPQPVRGPRDVRFVNVSGKH